MTSTDWFPDRLLLIRFGLQDIAKRRPKPEENKSLPTTKLINFVSSGSIGQSAQTQQKTAGDDYFNQISEQFRLSDGKEAYHSDKSDQEKSEGNEVEEKIHEAPESEDDKEDPTGKPSKSLFESIFNDGDEEDEY